MRNKSIFDDDMPNKCFLCKKQCNSDEHFAEHHVFEGPCRTISDRLGLVIHLCGECHSLIHDSAEGADKMLYLHQEGQKLYEQRIGNRRAFIQDFIRSYL